jgi:hypothetical protein
LALLKTGYAARADTHAGEQGVTVPAMERIAAPEGVALLRVYRGFRGVSGAADSVTPVVFIELLWDWCAHHPISSHLKLHRFLSV